MTLPKGLEWALCVASMLAATGCTTGEGEGRVESDQLFIENCWNGPFNLAPDFFGAVPYDEKALFIRVQRSDNYQEVSDGLIVLVNDLKNIRRTEIGKELPVGLPAGVSPPGVPITLKPNPPRVNLTLYLHDTCHGQNADIYSIDGKITFTSLFSGNPNEHDAGDRLTEATFEADFADPRNASADGTYKPGLKSTVRGYFKFYFQRGQPAQPFL